MRTDLSLISLIILGAVAFVFMVKGIKQAGNKGDMQLAYYDMNFAVFCLLLFLIVRTF